jgi:hypothetical protein
MWHHVDLVWTNVLEERTASIFRVEESLSEEPPWVGGCRLSHLLITPSYITAYNSFTFLYFVAHAVPHVVGSHFKTDLHIYDVVDADKAATAHISSLPRLDIVVG